MSGQWIGSGLAFVAAIVGPWLVYRVNKKSATTDAAQRQIDQIQEDRQADREQFEKAANRFEERQRRLEERLESLESINRISNDYVYVLRAHISEGRPPPPPPFPPEMTRGMANDR